MTCGIYRIRNKKNNRCYIGSSKFIERRLKQHIGRLKQGNHHSNKLQTAWNEYNVDDFEFSIIAVVEESKLAESEIAFINQYNSWKDGYNGTPSSTREPVKLNLIPIKATESIENQKLYVLKWATLYKVCEEATFSWKTSKERDNLCEKVKRRLIRDYGLSEELFAKQLWKIILNRETYSAKSHMESVWDDLLTDFELVDRLEALEILKDLKTEADDTNNLPTLNAILKTTLMMYKAITVNESVKNPDNIQHHFFSKTAKVL